MEKTIFVFRNMHLGKKRAQALFELQKFQKDKLKKIMGIDSPYYFVQMTNAEYSARKYAYDIIFCQIHYAKEHILHFDRPVINSLQNFRSVAAAVAGLNSQEAADQVLEVFNQAILHLQEQY